MTISRLQPGSVGQSLSPRQPVQRVVKSLADNTTNSSKPKLFVRQQMVVFQAVSDMFNNNPLHGLTTNRSEANWAAVT